MPATKKQHQKIFEDGRYDKKAIITLEFKKTIPASSLSSMSFWLAVGWRGCEWAAKVTTKQAKRESDQRRGCDISKKLSAEICPTCSKENRSFMVRRSMVAMWLVAESTVESPLILQQHKYRFRPQTLFQATVSAHILQYSTSAHAAVIMQSPPLPGRGRSAVVDLTERRQLGLPCGEREERREALGKRRMMTLLHHHGHRVHVCVSHFIISTVQYVQFFW